MVCQVLRLTKWLLYIVKHRVRRTILMLRRSTNPYRLSGRKAGPGFRLRPAFYWWYFPRTELDRLRVAELCDMPRLQLRLAPDGKVSYSQVLVLKPSELAFSETARLI